MKTIPYRCDDTRHKALLGAARSSGTSVQRLFDNFVTHVVAERQAEAHFVTRQKRGNPARDRKLLAEIRQRLASQDKKSRPLVARNYTGSRGTSRVKS